mgnify:CR=1 FL=1
MTELTFNLKREDHDDIPVTIRPRTSVDHEAVVNFYDSIPVEEAEFFIVDIKDPAVLAQWFEPNDFVDTIAMLAESEGKIVGEAVLIRQKNPRLTHVGNIRFYIHPDFRKAGLGASLVSSLFTRAMNNGIEKICIYMPEMAANKFQKMLARNGFSKEAVLKDHYRTRAGEKTDIIVYGRDLEEVWHRISDWVSNYGRAMEY